MEIRLAEAKDPQKILKYNNPIRHSRLDECVRNQLPYVLCDENEIPGVLRYNLFRQSIPFLDLLYIDEACQGKGCGAQMMHHWEKATKRMGYLHVMLNRQIFRRIGAFQPRSRRRMRSCI